MFSVSQLQWKLERLWQIFKMFIIKGKSNTKLAALNYFYTKEIDLHELRKVHSEFWKRAVGYARLCSQLMIFLRIQPLIHPHSWSASLQHLADAFHNLTLTVHPQSIRVVPLSLLQGLPFGPTRPCAESCFLCQQGLPAVEIYLKEQLSKRKNQIQNNCHN